MPAPLRSLLCSQALTRAGRAKARTWRERHHPDSIEKRHARSAADRRVEYSPDRDGMAWISGGDAGLIPSPKAHVLVTVPVFALMGLTEEPATLDGYGPIPPSMRTALVADGAEAFHRVQP